MEPWKKCCGISGASGGNRTHNPRITNAVLCQLKLRWHGEQRRRYSGLTTGLPAFGIPHSSARCPRTSRDCCFHGRSRPGGRNAAGGFSRCHPLFDREISVSGVTSPRPRYIRPWTKKGGASDSAGASCHGHAGQGQGDRTPEKVGDPTFMGGLPAVTCRWRPNAAGIGVLHTACQTCRRSHRPGDRPTDRRRAFAWIGFRSREPGSDCGGRRLRRRTSVGYGGCSSLQRPGLFAAFGDRWARRCPASV